MNDYYNLIRNCILNTNKWSQVELLISQLFKVNSYNVYFYAYIYNICIVDNHKKFYMNFATNEFCVKNLKNRVIKDLQFCDIWNKFSLYKNIDEIEHILYEKFI